MEHNNQPQRVPGPVARWLLQPIGWASHCLTGIAAAVAFWSMTPPDAYLVAMLLGALLFLIVDVIWAGQGLLRIIVAAIFRQRVGALPGGWKPWLVVPAVHVLMVVLLMLQIPFYTGFSLSRPAMERLAHQAKVAPNSVDTGEQRIGLYRTKGVEIKPWGLRFEVNGTGFMSTHGFAYSPGKAPDLHATEKNDGHHTYKYITGDWYQGTNNQDWESHHLHDSGPKFANSPLYSRFVSFRRGCG